MECDRSPDISRIDVFPCLSDYAGTDSAVRLALQSEKELCFTNVLDNNGNDLARGWKNSYRQVTGIYPYNVLEVARFLRNPGSQFLFSRNRATCTHCVHRFPFRM